MTHPRTRTSMPLPVLILIGLVTALSACSGADADEGSTSLTVADQDYETVVPFRGSGATKGTPYDLQFAQFNGGEDVIAALQSGAADIGSVGEAPAILAINSGVDDLAVIAISASPGSQSGYYLVAQPGSGINSVPDLKGKQVAYPGGTGREMVYSAILDKAGLDPHQDVNSVDMSGSEVAPAFASGSVDAAILEGAEYFGVGAPPVLETGHGYTNNMKALIVRRDTLDDQAKLRAIRDFLTRAVQAQNWAAANSEQAIKLNYVQQQNLTQREGRQLQQDLGVQRYYPIDGDVTAAYQDVADQLHDTGVIDQPVDVEPYLETSLNDVVVKQNQKDNVTPKPITK
jgi:sulfonate transport system substrate-binding protein